MAKADLHVHSKYSEHPSEWFLQRLGAAESYTDPEVVYTMAKQRGMDFVTITDHNRIQGSLILKEKYDDVFTGVETTTYFPEDMCKIHLLIYGLTQEEFDVIQQIRTNIYDLRDYIKERQLAYSVAHATYSVNGKITVQHLEKLILLFDVFESINGGRNRMNNEKWARVLSSLTPGHIDRLRKKHGIEPISEDPWIKSFTGGSDDHAGLFTGKTCTIARASTPDEFLYNLRTKKTNATGRHNDYQGLAFTVYKIAYQFSRQKSRDIPGSFIQTLNDVIFNDRPTSFRERFTMRRLRSRRDIRDNPIKTHMLELVQNLRDNGFTDVEEKLGLVYDKITDISDEFFRIVFSSFEKNVKRGNLEGIIKSVSSSLPGVFLSLPFFTTLSHMYQGRELMARLEKEYLPEADETDKKILWFTDTLGDLNGVAATINETGWVAYHRNRDIRLVTSVPEDTPVEMPPGTINLASLYAFPLPYYESLTMRIPSVLKAIKQLSEYEPDEIYISTPGPIGLLGLLVARLLQVKCTGVYHTDFTMQVSRIVDDSGISNMVEAFTKWFYTSMDTIAVPTMEYMDLLESRGFDRTSMVHFKKAIDEKMFTFRPGGRDVLKDLCDLDEGINLLYAGRMSQDKSIDFIVDIHRELRGRGYNVNTIFVGDGPYYREFRGKHEKKEGLYFTGRLPREMLPKIYSGADLFVFPSITDTFGMVVLEAQGCGLPAVVSDIGGPREIIIDGETGTVASNGNLEEWVTSISRYLDMIEKKPGQYMKIREKSHDNAQSYTWDVVLDDLFGLNGKDTAQHVQQHIDTNLQERIKAIPAAEAG